jgi:hypothetical protein
MPIQIHAPDGSIAEFPDGMADTDIEAVMQRHYPMQKAAQPSLYERSLSNMVPDNIFSAVGKMALQNPAAVGEELKGVPILGGAMPQTKEMTQFEQEHPWGAAGLNMAGGMGAMAGAAALAPAALGLQTPGFLARAAPAMQNAARLGIGTTTAAGTGAADYQVRKNLAPETGQPVPQPSALMNKAGEYIPGVKSTGNETADAALFGAGANVAGAAAGNLAGSVIAPQVRNAAQQLYNRGMRMTGGQAVGGWPNRIEKGGEIVPFSGIAAERQSSLGSFNRVAENEALTPLNTPEAQAAGLHSQVPDRHPQTGQPIGPGYDGRTFVREELQRAYDAAYQGAHMWQAPDTWWHAGRILRDYRSSGLFTGNTANRFAQIADGQVNQKFSQASHAGVPLQGDAISSIDTELRQQAENYRLRGGDDANLGRALEELRQHFHNEFQVYNPQSANLLNAADQGWGAYARLRTAGASTAKDGAEGLFTPEQLSQAAKAEDKSFSHVRFSEGNARMQPLARWGQQVLGEPKGGGAEGYALLGGLAGGVLEGHPGLLAAPMVSQALYSPPMQRALSHYLMGGQGWRQPAAEIARTSGRMGAFAVPPAGYGMYNALGQTPQGQAGQ